MPTADGHRSRGLSGEVADAIAAVRRSSRAVAREARARYTIDLVKWPYRQEFDAIWQRLADYAAESGYARPARNLTTHPALRVSANGREYPPIAQNGSSYALPTRLPRSQISRPQLARWRSSAKQAPRSISAISPAMPTRAW